VILLREQNIIADEAVVKKAFTQLTQLFTAVYDKETAKYVYDLARKLPGSDTKNVISKQAGLQVFNSFHPSTLSLNSFSFCRSTDLTFPRALHVHTLSPLRQKLLLPFC